jgi:hypothetical protein
MNLISIPFTSSAVISSHQGELLLITPQARMDLATTPRSKHCGLASEGVSEGPASAGLCACGSGAKPRFDFDSIMYFSSSLSVDGERERSQSRPSRRGL